MSNQKIIWKNGKEWLNQLVILHISMVIIAILITFVIYYIATPVAGGFEDSPIPSADIIGAVLALLGIIASNFIFRSRLLKIQKVSGLNDKLLQYRETLIISYAIIEFACMSNIILAFLAGNIFNLYIALAVAVLFFFKRPVKQNIFKDLMLNTEEIREFETV